MRYPALLQECDEAEFFQGGCGQQQACFFFGRYFCTVLTGGALFSVAVVWHFETPSSSSILMSWGDAWSWVAFAASTEERESEVLPSTDCWYSSNLTSSWAAIVSWTLTLLSTSLLFWKASSTGPFAPSAPPMPFSSCSAVSPFLVIFSASAVAPSWGVTSCGTRLWLSMSLLFSIAYWAESSAISLVIALISSSFVFCSSEVS